MATALFTASVSVGLLRGATAHDGSEHPSRVSMLSFSFRGIRNLTGAVPTENQRIAWPAAVIFYDIE